MKSRYFNFILILFSVIFLTCNEDNSPINDIPSKTSKGLIILNEGLYGQNNSTITYYDFQNDIVYQDYYSLKNDGKKLGDTGNDIKEINKKILITVDYSNKLELIDKETFRSLGIVDMGKAGSPREIAIVDSNTAFVSNALIDKVSRVDLINKKIVSQIDVASKPEGIEYFENFIYVANSGFGTGNTISIIDINTNKVVKILKVGDNPRFILKDPNRLYVICSGKYDITGKGGIYFIDPLSKTITDSIIINENPQKSCLFGKNKILSINNAGVLLIDLIDKKIEKLAIDGKKINPSTGIVYSITYDEKRELIYCGNPKTYTQNGEIVFLNNNFQEIKRIPCGLNPGVIKIINE